MEAVGHLLDQRARGQHGLVTRADLIRFGVPDSTAATLRERGVLHAVQAGVYRLTGSPITWEQRVLAAALAAGPAAVASHRSAAALWGFSEGLAPVEVTVPYSSCPEPRRTRLHRSTDLVSNHVTARRQVPVTKPARTLVDLGAVAPFDQVALAVETAVVSKLVTVQALLQVLAEVGRRGRRGAGVLRAALEQRPLGAERAESVLEAFFARLVSVYGLAGVVYQHEVVVEGRRRRVDFAIPDALLGIEVDGEAIHGTSVARAADRQRDLAFAAIGWQLIRVGWIDLTRRPAQTVRRLQVVADERTRLLRRKTSA